MNRRQTAALMARLVLGTAFIVASLDKLFHPQAFADVILGYQLVHPKLVTLIAVTLPWIELVSGALLLIGFLAESCALIQGGLSGVFAMAVTSALMRGLDIQCGCFTVKPGADTVAWSHLGLDLVLLLLAVVVLVLGPGPVSVDGRLGHGAGPQGLTPE